jgi:stage V sporulation protein G
MDITDVRIRKIEQPEGKLRGVASITIDDAFVVHDIKVIQGDRGLFIAMPSRKTSEGDYRDIAHPINTHARDKIQTAILNAYEKSEDELA